MIGDKITIGVVVSINNGEETSPSTTRNWSLFVDKGYLFVWVACSPTNLGNIPFRNKIFSETGSLQGISHRVHDTV